MTGFGRIFTASHRVFFLAAGLFGAMSVALWEGWLAAGLIGGAAGEIAGAMPFAMAPHLWHAHELIFGYASAAIAGFLLTAAPSWVGGRGAGAGFLAFAASVWLAGRLAMFFSGVLHAGVAMAADLAFAPVIAARVAAMLLKDPKPRQLVFLALLAMYFAANLSTHLEWVGLTEDTADRGLRAGLLTLSTLIMVLGGRVTPAFTRNAMRRAGREAGLPVDARPAALVAIAGALLTPLLMLAAIDGAPFAAAALAAGLAGLARLAGWRGAWTLNQPILWSLHLGYAMNAAGLILLGLSALGVGSEVAALHILGIGAVGGMTLAVMSRAALGHSGRPLIAPWPIALGYAAMPVAALARFAGAEWPGLYYPGVLTSGALWIAAFLMFCAALWPVFTGPRPRLAEETD